MKNTDNIEQLFKETFEHFEADVNPQVWANVQSGINSVGGSAASAAAKFTIGKIIVPIAIGTAVVAGSVWYFSTFENKINSSSDKQNKTEPVSTETARNIVAENPSTGNPSSVHANKQNASSLKKNSSDNSLQTEIVSGSSDNASVSDVSNSENTTNASSQSEHKYGKSSDAPTSMMRGSQNQNAKSTTSSKDNSSSDNLNEEQVPDAAVFTGTESGDAPPIVTFTNIPNIFTPNGDGENDMFFFKLKNIASIGVVIFNRKNGNVCSWNTLDGAWNGKLPNGKDAPEGVYFYSIRAIGTDLVEYSQKGFVELKR